jgi:hypothetical protein
MPPPRDTRPRPGGAARDLAAALILAATVALCGCGARRPLGQADGIPVSFVVHLQAGYLEGMSVIVPTAPPMFLEPDPWYGSSSRFRYYGRRPYGHSPFLADPFWSEPGYTTIVLAGGDAPREAGLFRTHISFGEDRFDVLIRPGREVTLTVQVRGGREGWETIGHFTSVDRPGQRVEITLAADGPKMVVVPPPSAVAGAPAAPAAPAADPVTPR